MKAKTSSISRSRASNQTLFGISLSCDKRFANLAVYDSLQQRRYASRDVDVDRRGKSLTRRKTQSTWSVVHAPDLACCLDFMEVPSDAGSVIEVESNPSSLSPWAHKYFSSRRPRTIRRKRKPMTSPQVFARSLTLV